MDAFVPGLVHLPSKSARVTNAGSGFGGGAEMFFQSFRSTGSLFDFHAHVELCMLIKASLFAVLQLLDGRTRLSRDEFASTSLSWRQKYTDRLFSLDR
jgi:hypothetical protein